MVIIKKYREIFNKFPEISGKIGINTKNFPLEISELTTLLHSTDIFVLVAQHRHNY